MEGKRDSHKGFGWKHIKEKNDVAEYLGIGVRIIFKHDTIRYVI